MSIDTVISTANKYRRRALILSWCKRNWQSMMAKCASIFKWIDDVHLWVNKFVYLDFKFRCTKGLWTPSYGAGKEKNKRTKRFKNSHNWAHTTELFVKELQFFLFLFLTGVIFLSSHDCRLQPVHWFLLPAQSESIDNTFSFSSA